MIIRTPYTPYSIYLRGTISLYVAMGSQNLKPQEFFPPVIDATERYAVRDESSGVMACKASAVAG